MLHCLSLCPVCSCTAQADVLSAVNARFPAKYGQRAHAPCREAPTDLLQSHFLTVSILVHFKCCSVLHQIDRRDVLCHLVGRECGKTRLLSNAQCAQAASSGRLVFPQTIFDTHTTWSHTIFHTHNFVTQSHTTLTNTHKHFLRNSFRVTGLRFLPSRWHCPAPSRGK